MERFIILVASMMMLISCGSSYSQSNNTVQSNTQDKTETTSAAKKCEEKITRVDRCIGRQITHTSASYTLILTENGHVFEFWDNKNFSNVREGDIACFEKFEDGRVKLTNIVYMIYLQ